MNGLNIDSTKVLTEKLALARELATLKPELEHLRSQAAYQQTVLSDKLALQRQVSTLEVELETEKRASKRASDKSKKELELQQQVEDLQRELSREKREREKTRKETEKELTAAKASKQTVEKGDSSKKGHSGLQQDMEALQKLLDDERRERETARTQSQKELNESETQITLLQGKLDHVRTKMRATKQQLKECQGELEEARAAVAKGSSTLTRADILAKSARKRSAAEMSTDVSIGTPDGGAFRGKKKGRMDQTMPGAKSTFSITPYLNRTARPGEKSMFSITPYLNRTARPGEKSIFSITPHLSRPIDIALETPGQESDEGAAEGKNEATDGATTGFQQPEEQISDILLDDNSPSRPRPKPRRKIIPKKAPVDKKTLGEASIGISNRKRDSNHSRSTRSLEMVTEEDGNENKESGVTPVAKKFDSGKEVVKTTKVPVKNAEEAEPKKKKRKLLGGGKTVFDEAVGEATSRSTNVTPWQSRSVGRGFSASSKGVAKGGLGAASAFGTFSPLKKDRKGVEASFLA
jgi:hypothetical protein